jgi:hypothetical protein
LREAYFRRASKQANIYSNKMDILLDKQGWLLVYFSSQNSHERRLLSKVVRSWTGICKHHISNILHNMTIIVSPQPIKHPTFLPTALTLPISHGAGSALSQLHRFLKVQNTKDCQYSFFLFEWQKTKFFSSSNERLFQSSNHPAIMQLITSNNKTIW